MHLHSKNYRGISVCFTLEQLALFKATMLKSGPVPLMIFFLFISLVLNWMLWSRTVIHLNQTNKIQKNTFISHHYQQTASSREISNIDSILVQQRKLLLERESGQNYTDKSMRWPIDINFDRVVPTSKNRTKQNGWLLYNRVPKTASTTVQKLIKEMGIVHGFQYVIGPFNPYCRNESEQLELLNQIYKSRLQGSFAFDTHAYYVNLEKWGIFGHDQVNLINVIRDPVERHLSYIFYESSDRLQSMEKLEEFNLTHCLESKRHVCILNYRRTQTCFFAGNIKPCATFLREEDTMFVLQMAKQNVENHYSVVGLTERLEDTLILFEAYLPRFFKGALQKYGWLDTAFENVNEKSKTVSDIDRKLIYSDPLMLMELDFYNFIVQRFEVQIKSVDPSIISTVE